jgi:Lrp/AsnC family transcriptional regulator|tara:strand:- start:9202 stop:9657 length:456 start_codon:yes stop_codon:yes gene_type:complete
MDKQDRAILEHIQGDASLSAGELAEKIGISKSACWRRLQKLSSDGIVKGRVAILDPEKLNLSLTVYISIRTNEHNAKWANKFQQVTQKIPGVLEVYRMSGDLDYLVKAVVADMKGYDNLYKQLIKADLFDVSSSFVMETMKQTTELPLGNF